MCSCNRGRSLERYLQLATGDRRRGGDFHEDERTGRGVGETGRQCSSQRQGAGGIAAAQGLEGGKSRLAVRCLREICSRRPRSKSSNRLNIGIDLGTTNSALAFIDPQEAAETGLSQPSDVLEVPQSVAQGRIEPRRTLPSFLYLGDQEYVGVYAREQGALVPTKSGAFGEELAVESGGGSHGQDSPVGRAGGAGAFCRRSKFRRRILAQLARGLGRASRAPNSASRTSC